MKSDPFYGFLGKKNTIESVQEDENSLILNLKNPIENIEEYIGNQMMYLENQTQEKKNLDGTEFDEKSTNNHSFGFLKEGAVLYKFLITGIVDSKNIRTDKRFFSRDNGVLEFDLDGKDIEIYKSNELRYDDDIRDERGLSFDKFMYIDNGEEELIPLRPSFVERDEGGDLVRFIFQNKTLPVGSNVSSNLVAGYKLFLNKKARIHAEVRDPASGRKIKSNTVIVNVSLPKFLKSSSGFKIGGGENLEDGFGGSNFLKTEQQKSIDSDSGELILYNPFRNGINIIVDNTDEG